MHEGSRLSLIVSLVLAMAVGCVLAQGDPSPDDGDGEWDRSAQEKALAAGEARRVELPDPELYSFDTTGFRFDIEAEFEPVIRESSNASFYSVTYQRRAADGKAYGSDGGMPFIRLTQTVEPLAELGTERDLLAATVAEAQRVIESIFLPTDKPRRVSDCSQEILGEVRFGKRIDIAMLADGGQAYVECYAFEAPNGHGVGVTLKIVEPPAGVDPVDILRTGLTLSSLEVKTLSADDTYFYSLAGYPLALPVRSKIERARRLNDFVHEVQVALEQGTLRVQVIHVPEGRSPGEVAGTQLEGFARALDQQEASGQLRVNWSSPTALPWSQDDGLVRGMCHSVDANGSRYYSAMYTAVDGRIVVAANFSGLMEHASSLSANASDFFARRVSGGGRATQDVYYGDYRLELPRGVLFSPLPGSDGGEGRGAYFVSASSPVDPGHVLESPLHHMGYTLIEALPAGEGVSLERAHRALCERELGRHSDGGDGAEQDYQIEAGEWEDARGRRLSHLTTHLEVALPAALREETGRETASVTIRSYLVPGDGGAASDQVVSTISGSVVFHDLDRLTRGVIEWIAPMAEGGAVELSFGSLELGSEGAFARRRPLGGAESGLSEHLVMLAGDDTLTVRTHRVEDGQLGEGREDQLAARYLAPAWDEATGGEDGWGAFPSDEASLASVMVAGREGLMFEGTRAAGDDASVAEELVRVVGIAHEAGYSVVTVRVRGEGGAARADELLGQLRAGGGA